MKIKRRGANRDHGTTSIDLNEPQVNFTDGKVKLHKYWVHDFNGQSQHDYFVDVNLAEFFKMFDVVVSNLESPSGQRILDQLKSRETALKRIVATVDPARPPFQIPPPVQSQD